MNNIPVHILQERTTRGFQIKHLKKDELKKDAATMSAHRDDHYIFFVLESGMGSLMVDFDEVKLSDQTLYYILPGQVHHSTSYQATSGWFIAVDTSLVPQECRNVFESQLILQQPHRLTDPELNQFTTLLLLLLEKNNEEASSPFHSTIVHSLLQSFIGITAEIYSNYASADTNTSRPQQISNQFKRLLSNYIRSSKSPSYYAAQLNITEAYLTEILKKQTGFSASYWIQQEVVMEAKRLLYYSELGVKEIAHNLGYSDHSYFSRFFKKATGVSALTFREQYRN